MSLILCLTGLVGFLASFTLLHVGVFAMWLRYPIAISIAYGVFLLLLRLWLWVQGRDFNVDFDLDLSGLDYIGSGRSDPSEGWHYEGPCQVDAIRASGSSGEGIASSSGHSISSSGSHGIGFDLDLEEGWLVVIAVIALIGTLLASLYIVYIAPALLAEILIDGVLVIGLYNRVKHVDQPHWLQTAIRRTLLPAVLVVLLFTLAGYAMQKVVPGTHSIGEVWQRCRGK